MIASAAAPQPLAWKHTLAPLKRLNRQLIRAHGAYAAGFIAALGRLSVTAPQLLADGSPLTRIECAFMATFWGARPLLQWSVFEPDEQVTTSWLAVGYHTLMVVFSFVTFAYALVATRGVWPA